MNVLLIPFFLTARIGDNAWQHGPEYTFHVQMNATAVPTEIPNGNIRLNVESKLQCQPKGEDSLSCHFEDSTVNTFISDNLDPTKPGLTLTPLTDKDAYRMNKDQFEIKFNHDGIDTLIVNEDLHPRELDMIKAVVGQMNVGAPLKEMIDQMTFNVTEKSNQGECETVYKIDTKIIGRALYFKHGFVLEPEFGLKDGQMIDIKKVRNLDNCTINEPRRRFGSEEAYRIANEFNSSDARMIISATEFTSSTSNVITTSGKSGGNTTTLYEHITLRLQSIHAAESDPPAVKNGKPTELFVHNWLNIRSKRNSRQIV